MYQLKCETCGKVIEGEQWELVAHDLVEHAKTCQAKPVTAKVKTISDVVPKEALEGNLTTIEELLGKLVLVTGMTLQESSFKEDTNYLSLTIEVDGEEKVLNTGAARVLSAFQALDPEQLPIYATFEKVAIPGGRRVYRVR